MLVFSSLDKEIEFGWWEVGKTLNKKTRVLGGGRGEDSALANHWLQNEINTALNENVSM